MTEREHRFTLKLKKRERLFMTGATVAEDSLPTADPIITAAVMTFARHGFDAPLRGIAAEAGVSAALIVKRYGSKAALRDACDVVVLEWIRNVKKKNINAVSEQRLMPTLVGSEVYAPLLGYVMRSVIAGGPLGRAFVEHMIDDAENYVADAEAKGLARPSRDERARTRYLVTSSIGSFLLTMLLDPPDDNTDLSALYLRLQNETAGPMLELFTEGLFTTRTMLDDYLRHVEDSRQNDDLTSAPSSIERGHQ